MAFLTNPKILICLVAFNRPNNLRRWLRAYLQCTHYDAKLLVVNNYLPQTGSEPIYREISYDEKNISGVPAVSQFLLRNNTGLDIGIFQDLCYDRLALQPELSNWDILYFTSDDCIPLRKDFLIHFIHPACKHTVGASGPQISDEMGYHLRTNCFCIRRAVARGLKFDKEIIEDRHDCYVFEHLGGKNGTLTQQIQRMGLQVAMPDGCDGNIHYATWDSGHYAHLQKWEEFWQVFPNCRDLGTSG